ESDPKWMARFNIGEEEKKKQEREMNYFSSPLMLITHKKNIDTFFNNVLIHFRERLAPPKTGDSFKDFMDIQDYKGMPKKDNKLVTERYSNYPRQVYPRSPGKEGDYFMKLLEELYRDGVTVILVTLPDYFGSYKTNFQRTEFLLHLKRLGQQYKNIHLLNYNRPGKFPLENTDYFNDGGYGQTNSHLSKKGAKALNELLTEEIRKYYGD
ncbi:MAG: hypothetical protein GY950_22575, partial [bacterium]|nr:hypothetical protein [bacterium]